LFYHLEEVCDVSKLRISLVPRLLETAYQLLLVETVYGMLPHGICNISFNQSILD